ncbi:MAG: Wzz/FepE/Etk N-terminal domain-containing protein [Capnocytophaga sp.]|nr:Wzz/FepE/Etk N-terminal domain-containing protein [Capnocytophaga sp.]
MENKQIGNEEEIDLVELLRKIWNSRGIIIKITSLFIVLGVLAAIFSAKEYTASTVMIPQTSGSKTGGGLGSLAAMAGINLGSNSSEAIPPTLYPKIVESVPFRQKLLETPISIEGFDDTITYRKYYKEYNKPGVIDYVKKYTIGLPGLILGGRKDKKEAVNITDADSTIVALSREEFDLINGVKNQININVNDKEGYVTLSYIMPEALASAQMLQNAQELLQHSITEFKIKKAKEELDFIEQRYLEVEKDFKSKQFALAQFQDHNRNLYSNLPQTRLQQLQTEFNLAYNLYSELAKQLETQKIKVKEETPVFTVIEPVTVPIERSKPKRLIIIAIWMFLGLALSIGYVFGRDFVRQFNKNGEISEEE